MRKQNVIVFSSFKSLPIVEQMTRYLNQHDSLEIEVVNWRQYFDTVYGLEYGRQKSYPLFRFLTKRIPSFDFAIIVAGRDDTVLKNVSAEEHGMLAPEKVQDAQQVYMGMRDNVIFELGMCCMALGESRVILLHQEGVLLFADLRGFNDAQNRVLNPESHSYEDTPLTCDNIQLKAIDYKDENSLEEVCNEIREYIMETAESFAPVVVGAACATASGYYGNFVGQMIFALDKYANQNLDRMSVGGAHPVELMIPNHPEWEFDFKNLENLEIHIILPNAYACEVYPEILNDTRNGCNSLLYNRQDYGIVSGCHITDSRNIVFACKKHKSKLFIIDVPTTLLSSYRTAKSILDIEDDANDSGQQRRYMTKEIDMFRITLQNKIDEVRRSGKLFVKCVIDEVSFDKNIDGAQMEWLYD